MTLLPHTFRSRMALLFGALSLLVGLPTYWLVSQNHRQQLLEDQRAVLQSVARSTATVVAENLVERRREIELLAQSDTFRQAELDSPTIRQSLERLKLSYPHYSWIGLADADGVVQSATSGHLVSQSVAQRPWFSGGKQGVFVGDVHEAVLLAKLLPQPEPRQVVRFIDFASPVIAPSGELRGVLASHAHWQWAGAVLAAATPQNAAETGTEIFIVSQLNQVIHPEGKISGENVPAAAAVQAAKGDQAFWDWGQGRRYLTVTAAVAEPTPSAPLGWKVVVRQSEDAVLESVRNLQRGVLLIAVGSGVVFLILAWMGANAMSRPVEQLTRIARRIQHGEENVRFDTTTTSQEMQRLSEALSGMAATLLERKHALEASNHELESKVAERTGELYRLNQQLTQMARTDALTGLPNRMAANEALATEFARIQRGQLPCAVLMMDIDFFKRVNDTHGHPVGDAVLRHVADTVRHSLRESDFVARVGGEEFLVLLPMTDLAHALPVAEKIRAAVASAPLEPVGPLTLSVGASLMEAHDPDEDAAVCRADEWLYQAKAAGRNRVAAPAPPEAPR